MYAGLIRILNEYNLVNETYDLKQIFNTNGHPTTIRKTLYKFLDKYKLNRWAFDRANTLNQTVKESIAKVASDLKNLLLYYMPEPIDRPFGPEANQGWAGHIHTMGRIHSHQY